MWILLEQSWNVVRISDFEKHKESNTRGIEEVAYDCRGMTEGFFCSYFCNEQEFCITV